MAGCPRRTGFRGEAFEGVGCGRYGDVKGWWARSGEVRLQLNRCREIFLPENGARNHAPYGSPVRARRCRHANPGRNWRILLPDQNAKISGARGRRVRGYVTYQGQNCAFQSLWKIHGQAMRDKIRVTTMQLCRLLIRPSRNSIPQNFQIDHRIFPRQLRQITMNNEHVQCFDPIQVTNTIQKGIPVLAEISIRRIQSLAICSEKLKLIRGCKSVYDENKTTSPQFD